MTKSAGSHHMSIATVVSISGQAWARDADGNMRELRVGDTLAEGESLVTSDNGRVELDFADNLDPTIIEGGQVVAMTPELDADLPVDMDEFSALDEDLEALLAALDDDDIDLLDVLDATAAGAGPGGGADGGHSFVQLARIAENVDPLAFEFGMGAFEEPPEIEGAGLLAAEAEEEPELIPEPELLPPGSITVSIDNINSENVTQVPITGTTTNVPVGSTVNIVVTDQEGNTATTTTIVNPDGSYQTEIDLSNLVDGPITVNASTVDQIGETRVATDQAVLDATAPTVSVALEDASGGIYSAEEIEDGINATVTLGAGTQVGDTLVVVDGKDNELFNGPVTQAMLDDGLVVTITDLENSDTAVSVTATVTDPAGNSDTDSDNGVIDAEVPTVSVAL
ncbi:retention module-containing protein, partial [Halomonas sp. M5N1S17]|uniref:retention module-containing protein n=1 Tax=Halomonas alkalisoli TaxID=2907158 RepID=UPI001F1B1512